MSEKGNNKKGKKQLLIALIALLVVVAIAIGAIIYMQNKKQAEEKELAYTELIKEVMKNGEKSWSDSKAV